MVLDESTLERMLAAGRSTKEFDRPPAKVVDATDEFEVYERAAPEGITEHVSEQPPQDVEEYPPRQHAQPPQPAAPQQAPPAPPAPPQPAPQPPVAAPAQPQYAPPAPAPAPAPQQAPPAQPATPPRPQVFSAQRPTPQPAPQARAPAPAAQPARTQAGSVPRIAIVQSDYNSDVTNLMAQWALNQAQSRGAPIVTHVHVPGVFDVPLTTKLLAKRNDIDAIVVLGCVIQGETGHDELITREAARLLADIAYEFEKPIGLGIAGPRMTTTQAEARIKMGRNAVDSVIMQWETMRTVGN